MTRIRLVLMLDFFMVAHKADLIEVYEDMVEVLLLQEITLPEHEVSRSRHWKCPRLADDNLPPSPEKNQQAEHTRLKFDL